MWYTGIVTLHPTAWLFLRGKRQSTLIYGVGLIRDLYTLKTRTTTRNEPASLRWENVIAVVILGRSTTSFSENVVVAEPVIKC